MIPTGPVRLGRGWPLVFAFVAAVVLGACGHASGTERSAVRISTASGIVSLHVPVADSDAARVRGLQGRTHLTVGDGMAFVFGHPTTAPFWMKGVAVPLSIAFWDGRGRIVAIMDMPPCHRGPCPTFRPKAPYVGALEVARGWFVAHGVEVGDRVELDR